MTSSGGQTGTPITSSPYSTLTSTIIDARARQITRRDNTTDLPTADVTSYISEACREISRRSLSLQSSTTGTLAVDTNTITIPTDMIPGEAAIDQLYLDSKLLDAITFDEWRAGKMNGYAYRNGVIYVNPAPDTARSYTLYYRKYHSTSVASISLNDDFKMTIVYFVCKKIYDDLEQPDKSIENELKYENELAKNIPAEFAVGRIRSSGV